MAPALPGRRSGRALAVALLVVAAAVLAVHWPVLGAQATAMDDEGFVAFNRLVTHPGWTSAGRFFTEVRRPSTIRGYYTPLSMTSLMLDYAPGRPARRPARVPPDQPGACTHWPRCSSSCCSTACSARSAAAVAAGLLFGLHPLTVEPVAWVGERKTLLAACFALATLLAYVEHARTGRARWRVAAVGLFALALLAKPTVVALPLLLPLLDLWPLRRLSRTTLAAMWPFLLCALVSGAVTVVSHRATVGLEPPDWPRWPLQAAYLVAFYLGKIAWPAELTPAYRPPGAFDLANPAVLLGVAITVAVTVAAVLSWRRTRAPLVGWLVFLVALAPTLGLVKYSWVIASDKYVYFPALGLLLLVGAGLAAAWRAGGAVRVLAFAPLLLVVAAEARGVRGTLPHWRDSLTHFRYLAATAPDVAVIRNKLGTLLAGQGQDAEAVGEFRAALTLDPDYAFAHYNLGLVLRDHGALGEAIAHLALAADRLPDHAGVIADLARTLRLAGRSAEAEAQYRRALAVAPDDAGARLGLAEVLLGRRGGGAEAAGLLRGLVAALPDEPGPAAMMAWLLATSPDPAVRAPGEALAPARRAVELTGSRDADALDALAAAEAANGRFAEAVATARARWCWPRPRGRAGGRRRSAGASRATSGAPPTSRPTDTAVARAPGSRDPALGPHLQAEQRPERAPALGAAARRAPRARGARPPRRARPRRGGAPAPAAPRPARAAARAPRRERRREALLAAGQDGRRQQPARGQAQRPLAGLAAQPGVVGQAQREADERVPQERRARLDAVRHGAAVHLGQQPAAQVEVEVEQLPDQEPGCSGQPGNRASSARAAKSRR